MTARLPPSASVVTAHEAGKLHAPAAARNVDALCRVLNDHAPHTGRALEIASGTGQHVTAFARALPGLIWHPTEIDSARRASINAYVQEAGLPNLKPAAHLDATLPGWSGKQGGFDLIVLINLLHLIHAEACENLIFEALKALSDTGPFLIYGPFKRNGQLTSEGDKRFDADLRATDRRIGYKDSTDIEEWLRKAGATNIEIRDMPANNLAIVARKQ